MGAREVMEAEAPCGDDRQRAMDADRADRARRRRRRDDLVAKLIEAAKRPLIVTSYRRPQSRRGARTGALLRSPRRRRAGIGAQLRQLSPTTIRSIRAITGTIRSRTPRWRRPTSCWCIDSDVPWIPTVSRPGARAYVAIIDVDPMKQSMPLWYIHARRHLRADAQTALRQLNAPARSPRRRRAVGRAPAQPLRRTCTRRARRNWSGAKRPAGADITPEYLTACVRRQVGQDAIVASEGITNYHVICDHMARELQAPCSPAAAARSAGTAARRSA